MVDPRRPTMAAIAQEAGVSVPTVSKVVNARPDVAPETRERVEKLLRQHRYAGRTNRGGRKGGLIDLVLGDLNNPWAMGILAGVTGVADAHGIDASGAAGRWEDGKMFCSLCPAVSKEALKSRCGLGDCICGPAAQPVTLPG